MTWQLPEMQNDEFVGSLTGRRELVQRRNACRSQSFVGACCDRLVPASSPLSRLLLQCRCTVPATHASAAAVFSSFNTLTLALQRCNQWSNVRNSYRHFISLQSTSEQFKSNESLQFQNALNELHRIAKKDPCFTGKILGTNREFWYFLSNPVIKRLLRASASALPFKSLGPHYCNNQRKSPQAIKNLDGDVRIDRNNLTMQIAYITLHCIFCVYIGASASGTFIPSHPWLTAAKQLSHWLIDLAPSLHNSTLQGQILTLHRNTIL